MIQVTANVDGVLRVIEAAIDTVDDLEEPLKRLGGYLRAKAQRRFEQQGPGWAPLDPETIKAAKQGIRDKATGQVEKKLKRELKRAQKSGDVYKYGTRFQVLAEFERVKAGGSAGSTLIADLTTSEKGVMRSRNKIRRDLRRAKKAGATGAVQQHQRALDAFDATHQATLDRAFMVQARKSIGGLGARIERQQSRVGEKLLGKLASSIVTKVDDGTLIVESKVPWAGVHNDGGAAGKGAQIPKREFLKLEDSDLDVFQAFLDDAFEEQYGLV